MQAVFIPKRAVEKRAKKRSDTSNPKNVSLLILTPGGVI
jgi:hypothetical protein